MRMIILRVLVYFLSAGPICYVQTQQTGVTMKTNGDRARITVASRGPRARHLPLPARGVPALRVLGRGRRASRLFARRFEAAFGLSIAEWRVMAVVGRFGTLTPSAVAERTDMDKVKVSRATASLVATGLLEQGPAPHDGRARLLRLTRKGRVVHDGIVPLALALEAQLAAGLSEEEWNLLRPACGGCRTICARWRTRHSCTPPSAG